MPCLPSSRIVSMSNSSSLAKWICRQERPNLQRSQIPGVRPISVPGRPIGRSPLSGFRKFEYVAGQFPDPATAIFAALRW